MLAIERKNEILSILQKEQRVLVAELSTRYQVTEETIRRDLEKLEKEGFVKRPLFYLLHNGSSGVKFHLFIGQYVRFLYLLAYISNFLLS